MKMNLFALGGAGINIAEHFVKYANKQEPGFAEINPVFVDTSRSNLTANIPESMIYLVDGLDGSGKKRDTNYTVLSESSKDILHKFKPADINIVLHSGSGGKLA